MRLILNFVMNGIGVTRRLYLFQVLVHEVLDGIPVWMQEIPKQASADIQQKSPEIGYYRSSIRIAKFEKERQVVGLKVLF